MKFIMHNNDFLLQRGVTYVKHTSQHRNIYRNLNALYCILVILVIAKMLNIPRKLVSLSFFYSAYIKLSTLR